MRRLAATLTLLLTAALLGAPAPAQAVTPSGTRTGLTTSPDVARRIVGTVRDSSGLPLAGACVDVHYNQWQFFAHACTDAAGHYEVGGISDQLAIYRMQAAAPGYAARWWPASVEYNGSKPVTVPAPGVPRTVDFVLPTMAEASGTITGTIRRQDGTPASGAVVQVYTATGDDIETVYTRLDGSYNLGGLTAGQYRIQVYGAGYPTQYVPGRTTFADAQPQTVTAGATTTVNETFLPVTPIPPATTGSLTGTVRDPAGAAIAGADVQLLSPLAYTAETVAQTVTDQDGRFTLTGLAQDDLAYYLRTSAAGYASAWGTGTVTPSSISVSPAGSAVSVVLRPGAGAITGTLHDFDGGTPPRTRLNFASVDETVSFTTYAWFDGHFEIPDVPAGQYRLTLVPTSRLTQYWPGTTDPAKSGTITVTDKTTTDVQETLVAPARIEVTVLDDVTGQPVTGACVKGNTTSWSACAPAIAAGVYAYDSTAASTSFTSVTASRTPTYFPASSGKVSAVLGQTTKVTLRLRPGAVLALDYTVPANAYSPSQICFHAVTAAPFQPDRATDACPTVSGGHALLGPIPAGSAQVLLYLIVNTNLGALWVTDAGGGGDQRQATRFTFVAGQTTTGPTQHLLPSGSINGTVTGPGSTDLVCPGPVITGYGSCATGSYTQSGLGPYRWPVSLSLSPFGQVVGWTGPGANRFDAGYVQVTSGQAAQADIRLRPLSQMWLTVQGVPANTWTLTAFDPVTGDRVADVGVGRGLFESISVPGQVVLMLSAPSLAQPCYVTVARSAAPGRRPQPSYVIDPVDRLTITPGADCRSDITPSLQQGHATRR
ncbi:carboxypeptidase-like regulatory domain-containing protein [Hamadaea tsunoensis]|uniref:carboxypeptidase-like regulatory domain-containing protein n=1 Tax=Hamadaea tsunoensis TaxID=53368 RepID=UPI000405A286|nr:carboxypeptidase-like regulatory domain-containing protein [Hamadaea tsunoensis]